MTFLEKLLTDETLTIGQRLRLRFFASFRRRLWKAIEADVAAELGVTVTDNTWELIEIDPERLRQILEVILWFIREIIGLFPSELFPSD